MGNSAIQTLPATVPPQQPPPGNFLDNEEELIWKGTPSQWMGIGHYILLCWTVLGCVYTYYRIKLTKYEITTQRLKVTTGVFSIDEEELELFRVKDVHLDRPFLMRLVGLQNLRITTSDKTSPVVMIEGISNATELREKIRERVQVLRQNHGVREVDFNQ